ncbi:MAG: DUF3426 domain-containing protein [Gammaproteobacteria bacterium]
MQSFTTQCPHCSTTFKLSQNQLDAAQGAVRCGACMQVFNANDHVAKLSHTAKTAHHIAKNNNLALKPSQTIPRTEQSHLEQSNADTSASRADNPHWTQALTSDIEKIYQYLASELDLQNNPELATKLKDDQWAKDLLTELNHIDGDIDSLLSTPSTDTPIETSAPSEKKPSTDETPNPKTKPCSTDTPLLPPLINEPHVKNYQQSGLRPPLRQTLAEAKKAAQAETLQHAPSTAQNNTAQDKASETPITPQLIPPAEETESQGTPSSSKPNASTRHTPQNWSNNLLDELDNQSRHIAENIKKALDQSNAANDTAETADNESTITLSDLAKIPLSEQRHEDTADINPAPNASAKDASAKEAPESALSSLMPELDDHHDTELSASPVQHPPFHWGYFCASLLAAITLAVQILVFEAPRLAQNFTYRPYYESICTMIGCTPPPLERFEDIKGTKLVVRAHPDQEQNALIVDLNLKNEAPFPQAFPDIELSFTSLSGDLLARRRFTPDEYRGDTLKKLDLMPVQQPLRITLEILNPGNEATNYQLKLYHNSESRS